MGEWEELLVKERLELLQAVVVEDSEVEALQLVLVQ